VGTLDWGGITWELFVRELQDFRERFYVGRSDEEHAYLRVREVLADKPYDVIAGHSRDIVWFLNQWACRLATEPATQAVSAYIAEHGRTLDEHRDSTITDARVERRIATYQRLYDRLLRFKQNGVPNMSDAAASKVLHQLNPQLFVMWDNNIKPYAHSYGDFMLRMHRLALRLCNDAPAEAQPDIDGFLQRELDYPVRKPLAKYLDEYNWYVAFGSTRSRR
jgi:hypothetical protein